MKSSSYYPTNVNHDETRRLAYQLWEAAARPHGQSLHFWLAAERQLIAAIPSNDVTSRAPHTSRKAGRTATALRKASTAPRTQRAKAAAR